ncbi:MAG: hypothetical protein GY797_03200 [Deltaproteobacteria bacterium]|nr:hypothetical protein [Deltaproteobacteria bacterium]
MIRFLIPEEIQRLHQILKGNELLKTETSGSRSAVLRNCDVEKVCGQLDFNLPIEIFILVLCDKLMPDSEIENEEETKPNLIIFLENLVRIFPNSMQNSDDITFIGNVIDKWNRRQKSSIQNQRKELEHKIAQAEHYKPQSIMTSQPISIDKKVIVNFDLDNLGNQFRKHLKYEGAFAFTVGGKNADGTILNNYIIERVLGELTNKTDREEYDRFDVHLNRYNISDGENVIERELTLNHECENFCDLFENTSDDIVLIIWNYRLLQIVIFTSNFFGHVLVQDLRHKEDACHC